jgi:hypothetical protein
MGIAYNTSIVRDGLVLHLDAANIKSYPGTGTSWFDLNQNHNLTLLGGITYNSADKSLVFDGLNDACQVIGNIPIASPISVTNNFTIEQVFKPTAYQASAYFGLTNLLMGKGTASTYNYASQITNDTTFTFIKRTSPEVLQFHNFTTPSMLNNVCVMTLVIQNGNDSLNDTVSCYFNGDFLQTLNITGTTIAAVDNDPFWIGGTGTSNQSTLFTGSYYSAKIYNRNLLAAEIKLNFEAQRGRYGI